MGMTSYTIGELARLSGHSVRRVRFYSDKGLLPPSVRTESNYRIYSDLDLAKLDLISGLREAGVSLAAIGALFRRRLSLKEVLLTRLEILDAEIMTKRRAATILRATLRSPEPEGNDLRRLWAVSKINSEQMHTLVGRFVDSITKGAGLADSWEHHLKASAPALPDDPSPEQLAAWGELAEMLTDETFVQEVRAATIGQWSNNLDPQLYRDAAIRVEEKAKSAISRGLAPGSKDAVKIAQLWIDKGKRASGYEFDNDFIASQLAVNQFRTGRLARYEELIFQVRGIAYPTDRLKAWAWIMEAVKAASEKI